MRGASRPQFAPGDVGGAAADIEHQGGVTRRARRVMLERRRHGFFQELHRMETSHRRGLTQQGKGLHFAGLAHGASEMHRPAQYRLAHVGAELGAGLLADMRKDARTNRRDGVLGARVQLVAEHGLRRFHQMAVAFQQVGLDRLVAEQRLGHLAGGGHGAVAVSPHAVAIGQVLGEVHRRAELRRLAETHGMQPAVDACRRSGIAGAEINADPHGGSVAGHTSRRAGLHATVARRR